MALSSVEYTADGSTQTFSLTFPYLSQDHVQVFVDGAEDATFTWATSSSVTLTSVPSNGAVVKISRTTPSTPLVDFVDGSNLTEAYLDTATRQSLYVAEETKDAVNIATTGSILDGSIEPVKLSSSFGSWVKAASASLARTALGAVGLTGGTFTGNIEVPTQKYSKVDWGGSTQVPTKEAISQLVSVLGGTKALYGFNITCEGGDTNFTVDAGGCFDSTGVKLIEFNTSFTKSSSGWSSGDTNGSLDTGSISADTWYHVFAILDSSTGNVDILMSLSPTAPNLPADYDYFRRIGSVKTNSGDTNFRGYIARGGLVRWKTPEFYDDTSYTATEAARSVMTPLGVQTMALVQAYLASSSTRAVRLYGEGEDDTVAVIDGDNCTVRATASGTQNTIINDYLTNTSSEIKIRGNVASSGLFFTSLGWYDFRGQE